MIMVLVAIVVAAVKTVVVMIPMRVSVVAIGQAAPRAPGEELSKLLPKDT